MPQAEVVNDNPIHRHRPVTGWRIWIGPLLAFCCVVECVGLVLVAPLLPTVLGTFTENPQAEGALWALSASLISAILWSRRSQLTRLTVGVWSVSFMVGVLALILDVEIGRLMSLLTLAALQLRTLRGRQCARHGHHG